jgi:radical SAM superfamily enzyme YgiQ (UPF0313 family)
MSINIAILNVPCTLSKVPHVAPALLKGSLVSAGFTVKTIDFNIKFFNELQNHIYFNDFQTYFLENVIDADKKVYLLEIIDRWVDDVLETDPEWIGISVFTYQCRVSTKHFCEIIRQKNPNIKIVLGGQGLSQGGINGINAFPIELQEKNLIDYYIKSEGEITLVDLLKGNTTRKGINTNDFEQVDDLDELSYPDYSDYDFSEYEFKWLAITGSRGCVRKCTFCDIHQHWEYRYRKGSNIFKEMKTLSERYAVNDFVFTDSLVNGNLKEFRNFLAALAEHNSQTDEKISWRGQYIVKPKSVDNPQHWDLMKRSDCKEIWIGVESGSERLRKEMQKGFTDEDLYNAIEQSAAHGISSRLLMFVGYPTESIDDFEKTLDLIKKYKHLAKTFISSISISDTVSILPGTPLYNSADKYDIILDDKYENNWLNLNYPELDLNERIRRVEVARKLIEELGYLGLVDGSHNLNEFLTTHAKIFETRLKIKKIVWMKQQNNEQSQD